MVDERAVAELVLDDIRLLSYDDFMRKHDPKATKTTAARESHGRMQRQLRLIKRLPRAFYNQVVSNMLLDEKFRKTLRKR